MRTIFVWRSLQSGPVGQRKKMHDPTAKLSVNLHASVLRISRGSVNYKPHPISDADLNFMQWTYKQFTAFPLACRRMLQGLLIQEGFKVGRLHFAKLMERMGIEALHRKPNTSNPVLKHKIYPYLSRAVPIT